MSRTVKLALARRIALKRPRKEEIEELEAAIAACTDEDERTELLAQLEKLPLRSFVMATPLPIQNGSGSPLRPIAYF